MSIPRRPRPPPFTIAWPAFEVTGRREPRSKMYRCDGIGETGLAQTIHRPGEVFPEYMIYHIVESWVA